MVLVTGATGILGRVVVLELLKRGKSVRGAKRPTSNLAEVKSSLKSYTPAAETLFDLMEWMDVDFSDIQSVQNVLTGVEEVYHCAAKVSFNPKDEAELFRTNVEATQNLLYACEGSSVKKFCFVSSIAVLDDFNEQGEMDESSDFNPKLNHSTYAITKHMAEMEAWRASAEGLNTVIVNPGMIIGSGNWGNSSGDLFPKFEKLPYTFSGGTAYVDVRDVAYCMVELMERNIFGERFILISENRRYNDIGNKIRTKLGLKPAETLSDFKLNVGRWANILFGWLIPPLRMATKSNIDAITSFSTISNRKIQERLNFEFIPVDESAEFHLKNYIADVKMSRK